MSFRLSGVIERLSLTVRVIDLFMNEPSSVLTGLPVAVDVMGADFGPEVVVEGAVEASREFGIPVVLVGQEDLIRPKLAALQVTERERISVKHAPEFVTMEDSPAVVIRGKPNCSVRIAFQMVQQGEACAVVSPGNSGAMMAAGISVCGILPGVVRPAIAALIPRASELTPTVLLDSGANVECHAGQLVQFATMGSFYATSIFGKERPRVALLSNGSEPSKGTGVVREAAQQLMNLPSINYVGYVEGRDIARDSADVVVCDGFVGNIALKAMEGTVELVFDSIRQYVEKSLRGKIGMWLAKPVFKALFKRKLDPSAYGGAPLLGLRAIGIVCHGSSSSRAIKNGVRTAWKFASEQVVEKIGEALAEQHSPVDATFGDGIWDRVGQRMEGRRSRARRSEER